MDGNWVQASKDLCVLASVLLQVGLSTAPIQLKSKRPQRARSRACTWDTLRSRGSSGKTGPRHRPPASGFTGLTPKMGGYSEKSALDL